ncbi:MAG: response regulator [Verrucomicrobia bacterium]|nr:response regulator [Verrucomicrobiota bacterium]
MSVGKAPSSSIPGISPITMNDVACHETSNEKTSEKTQEKEIEKKADLNPEASNAEALSAKAPKQFRILIAEDNKLMRRIIEKRVIEEVLDGSMVFDMAWDGNEAIEKARTTKYHLIFMDYMMPNCYGNHAVKAIREFDAETPIVLQTDSEQDELDVAFHGLSIQGSLNGKLRLLSQVVQTLVKLKILIQ